VPSWEVHALDETVPHMQERTGIVGSCTIRTDMSQHEHRLQPMARQQHRQVRLSASSRTLQLQETPRYGDAQRGTHTRWQFAEAAGYLATFMQSTLTF
jgi:hypothetical protein